MSSKKFEEFKQGVFTPLNKEKCLNKIPPFYRSSLERSLMIVLDKNPRVIAWNSEQTVIPYKHPIENRFARYFVDFYMKILIGEKTYEYIIEVKPKKQCSKPTVSKNKKQSTILYENVQWAINQAKWESARKWAKAKNMEFKIMTEEDIDFLGKA